MLTAALKNTGNAKNIVSTRLKEKFEELKIKLEIFKDLNVNEKLGKTEDEGKKIYYKVESSKTYAISRWWYGEGRHQTIKYLNTDFSEFTKFQEELIQNLDVDPMMKYNDLAKEVCEFIKIIIPGLNNLKKTYIGMKEMTSKVDTIIKSILEFKEKVRQIEKKNEKHTLMLQVSDYVVDKYCGPKYD
jgi:hypothetical protein